MSLKETINKLIKAVHNISASDEPPPPIIPIDPNRPLILPNGAKYTVRENGEINYEEMTYQGYVYRRVYRNGQHYWQRPTFGIKDPRELSISTTAKDIPWTGNIPGGCTCIAWLKGLGETTVPGNDVDCVRLRCSGGVYFTRVFVGGASGPHVWRHKRIDGG